MEILDNILDIIFPPECGICGKIGKTYICENCYDDIKKYLYFNENDDILHLLKYEGIIRDKLISYKFNDKSYLYKMFCEIFEKNKKCCDFLKKYDIIIPVPIHNKRRKIRGYNQSELIAKELAKKMGLQVYVDVLKKQVNTAMQSSLGKNERNKNVQDAYIVANEEKIRGKNIVILDDIYTTGSTVNECKKMLVAANKIGIITIAKD